MWGLCTIKPHKIFLSESFSGLHLSRQHFIAISTLAASSISLLSVPKYDRPWPQRPPRILLARPLHRLNSPKAGKSNMRLQRDTLTANDRLPQWEGVRRQWYYVQRTTGKSQWEIPTEPIHLTPSTTPSIGGGPSQAPQQANNITPGVGSENHMEGDHLLAADSARISVGNRAHYVCEALEEWH